jgi:beta-lactamase superfamily II metal-dependent hydrolase
MAPQAKKTAKKDAKKTAKRFAGKYAKKPAKKPAKKVAKKKATTTSRMQAPENGVRVRMYRPGHGDCFLLAFPREGGATPYYVMIDCGVKPGSQKFLAHEKPIGEVVKHIHESTGGHLDLVILTHEHQDHLNGLWKKTDPYFEKFTIGEAWVAWTEDPTNDLANELRRRHKDQLLGLIGARAKLAMAVGENDEALGRLDQLLAFEAGDATDNMSFAMLAAAAKDPEKSALKQGLKLIKDKASDNNGFYCLYPGEGPIAFEGSKGFNAYVLGPPEDADLIADEDPKGDEAFPREHGFSFASAADPSVQHAPPFSRAYFIPAEQAFDGEHDMSGGRGKANHLLSKYYGQNPDAPGQKTNEEAPSNAEWRRIEHEWLYSAESLAIRLNSGINNTSLVLAIELPRSKKVLLFAGDAQRGNWSSWSDVAWHDENLTTRDLLRRTVLYKVGHHGSHNATMHGTHEDSWANLSWMGLDEYSDEFTAMITAVNEWAMTKNTPPWVHPLPSIKKALLQKAEGRVFQTDTDKLTKPAGVSEAKWKRFLKRCTFDALYFDYEIEDK